MAALHPYLVAVCEAGAGTGFTLAHFFLTASLKAEYYYRINKSFADKKNPKQKKQNIEQMNHNEFETTEISISV